MSAEDWYRRHLGGGVPSRQAASPPSPYYPAPPQAYQAPPGYMLVPAQPQGYGQASAAPDPTAAYLAAMGVGTPGHNNPWAEPPPSPVDTARIPRGTVTPENFLQLAGLWRGGQGRKQAQHCPRCDGVLFRRFEGQREAAPMCTSCGWNGLWDQGEHGHAAA
jgi:hypothetical protein